MSSEHREREHVFDHRTGATRGLVTAVDDTGCAQTVDVQTHDGVTRGGVEVHLPFGFTSVPPPNGAVVVLVANGGDPSDMIALPAACPLGRFGGMQPGETAIYAADGTRVHIRAGGIVEILAATSVHITTPSCTLTCVGGITLTGTVTIAGDVSVRGNITATGSITADA